MQVDAIKTIWKAPKAKRLKLKYNGPPSIFAFKFNMRRSIKVEFGRWQDVLKRIVDHNDTLEGGRENPAARLFDGIFFDTYGEDYDDLREFHGRGLHSFTLELNLSNSRTYSWLISVYGR